MTTTAGGADKLKNTETLPAYKNVMLTRGRIVTEEDIKNYCSYYLQNRLQYDSIEIKRGVSISTKPKEGLINTLDVIIKPTVNEQKDADDWNVLKRGLLMNLEEQSAVGYNYRVIFN
jgi:hypothetical protein